jgi:branched-chain amino acid transport system permease protein
LLAIHDEFVNPQSYGFGLSLLLIVGAVVGGLGSLGGLAVGALFLQFLPDGTQWLGNHVGGVFKETGVPGFVFGAAIILIMLVLPGGAGQLLRAPAAFWELTKRRYPASKSEPGPLYEGEA